MIFTVVTSNGYKMAILNSKRKLDSHPTDNHYCKSRAHGKQIAFCEEHSSHTTPGNVESRRFKKMPFSILFSAIICIYLSLTGTARQFLKLSVESDDLQTDDLGKFRLG